MVVVGVALAVDRHSKITPPLTVTSTDAISDPAVVSLRTLVTPALAPALVLAREVLRR